MHARIHDAFGGGNRGKKGQQAPAPCGICGRPDHEIQIGPALFIEGSTESVCRKCGEKHAPALSEFLRLLRSNKSFITVLQDLRNQQLKESTKDF